MLHQLITQTPAKTYKRHAREVISGSPFTAGVTVSLVRGVNGEGQTAHYELAVIRGKGVDGDTVTRFNPDWPGRVKAEQAFDALVASERQRWHREGEA